MLYSATHADPNISSPVLLRAVAGDRAGAGLRLPDRPQRRQLPVVRPLADLHLRGQPGAARPDPGHRQRGRDGGGEPLARAALLQAADRRSWSSSAHPLAWAPCWPRGSSCGDRFRFVILCVLYVLIPGVLIFLQPDLGTALVFLAILVVMLVVWGIRLPHLGVLAGVGRLRDCARPADPAQRLRRQPAQGLPDADGSRCSSTPEKIPPASAIS